MTYIYWGAAMVRKHFNFTIEPRLLEESKELAWRHRVSLSRLIERLLNLAVLDDQLTSLALSGANVPIEEEDE